MRTQCDKRTASWLSDAAVGDKLRGFTNASLFTGWLTASSSVVSQRAGTEKSENLRGHPSLSSRR